MARKNVVSQSTIEYVSKHPGQNLSEISKGLPHLGYKSISAVLSFLTKKGVISTVPGYTRPLRYRLPSEGEEKLITVDDFMVYCLNLKNRYENLNSRYDELKELNQELRSENNRLKVQVDEMSNRLNARGLRQKDLENAMGISGD